MEGGIERSFFLIGEGAAFHQGGGDGGGGGG